MKKIFGFILSVFATLGLTLLCIVFMITGLIFELYNELSRALKTKRDSMRTSQRIQLKKTITWTVISFFVTTSIGWAVTGDIFIGLTVGVVDRFIKVFLYYYHERVWHKKYKSVKEVKRSGD